MEKRILEFLNNHNESNKTTVVNAIDEIEVWRKEDIEKYEGDIVDITWSYYDYSDKSLRELAEEMELVKAKRFLFEIWYLLETGKQYSGVMKDSENNLIFIDQ